MKTADRTEVNKILAELHKISEQLGKIESGEIKTGDSNIVSEFYRDSFDYMVDQNINLFNILKMLISEKKDHLKVA